MLPLNDHLLYQLQKKHHQHMIHEAEKERLIRAALSSRGKPAPFCKRTPCWLGHRLVAWGHNLLKRYEAVPGGFADSTLNLAK